MSKIFSRNEVFQVLLAKIFPSVFESQSHLQLIDLVLTCLHLVFETPFALFRRRHRTNTCLSWWRVSPPRFSERTTPPWNYKNNWESSPTPTRRSTRKCGAYQGVPTQWSQLMAQHCPSRQAQHLHNVGQCCLALASVSWGMLRKRRPTCFGLWISVRESFVLPRALYYLASALAHRVPCEQKSIRAWVSCNSYACCNSS